MGKKIKKSIELSPKKIAFTIENRTFKVIRYYPTQMSLDVMIFEDGVKVGVDNIPFAHIPKDVKKQVKPN